jgi:hypothetical protein
MSSKEWSDKAVTLLHGVDWMPRLGWGLVDAPAAVLTVSGGGCVD